jgi:hypothetical protein
MMAEPHVQVEFDPNYYGGDYSSVGQFVYLPHSAFEDDADLELAFEKQTGLPRCCIIHYCLDDLYTADGEPLNDD